ncbi:hypothetical protein [Bacillus dakarensis]|uniref:hypothetical protein n=1 Tax=Robertmurraya dakarensis TaxID=1926278 RepID=UPI000981248B|nr:hypothetical protein [Bacillus dakarensis]
MKKSPVKLLSAAAFAALLAVPVASVSADEVAQLEQGFYFGGEANAYMSLADYVLQPEKVNELLNKAGLDKVYVYLGQDTFGTMEDLIINETGFVSYTPGDIPVGTYQNVDENGKSPEVGGETPAEFEVIDISAVDETSVDVSFPSNSGVEEADLTGKVITLTAGDQTLTLTYSEGSLSDNKVTFILPENSSLVANTEYTVTSEDLVIQEGQTVTLEAPTLEVSEVSAINATSVTVTLPEALTEVPTAEDFIVTVGEETIAVSNVEVAEDGVTVTLTVDLAEKAGVLTVNGTAAAEEVNFVTPAEVVAAAEAIAAYEEATISTYADVAVVVELEVAAQTAVDAVADETVKTELQAQLDAQTAIFDEQLTGVVESVTTAATAGSTIQTKAALDAFGFEYETITIADLAVDKLQAVTTVQEIQAYFSEAQFVELVEAAVNLGVTADLTTVDDSKLYTALEFGVEKGLLTGVNFDKYFTTYVATIQGFATADAAKLTATGIQSNVIDKAQEATVTNAVDAVKTLTADSNDTVITQAEEKVAVVDVDSVFADGEADLTVAGVTIEVKGQNVKEALTAIVEDIKSAKLVYTVITASTPINQAKLNTALQEAGVERAYEDYIVKYATELEGLTTTADSLSEIQGLIDGVNDDIAEDLVNDAVANLTPENITAAETAINRLAPDVEGSRNKVATLTAQLKAAEEATANLAAAEAAVDALTNEDDSALAEGVGQAEIDAAAKLVEALPGTTEVTDPPADDFNADKAALEADLAAAQVLQDGVNLAAAEAAVDALTNEDDSALAEGVGQAEIDAAAKLVEALPGTTEVTDPPADDFNADKAALEADLAAAQVLQDGVNLAAAEAAVDALTNEDDSALAEGVGQAEIDAAAKLVEALPGTTEVTDPPADDFNADKAALEADLAAAQVLQDGVNLAAAEAAVDALTNEDDSALAEGVGQAEIDAAAKLVEALPGTTEVTDPPADDFNADKAALEADLAAAQVLQDGVNLAAAEAAVDALTNEDDSALAEGVGQAEIDAAAKLVEALPGTTEVTDPPADDFNADKAALEADLAAAQVLQDGVNLAAAEAAVDALTNEDDSALAEGVGQAEIDAAAKLVEALPGTTEVTDPPADDFNADKAALEADLAAAQVLQDGVNLAAAEAAVDALTNEDDSALAEGVGQAEIDAAAKLVEALPGTTEVTDPPADDFNADKAALEADLAAAQVLQDGVNLAAAEAAVDALTNEDDSALAEGVGQAEIDAAAKLVEALPGTTEVTDPPADDFNADKAALEADLAAAQVLQDGVNLAAAEAAVDALTNEDDSALAEGVGQAEIDAAAKLVEALPGTTEVTDPPADDFNADKAALEADLAAAQVLQDGVNLAAAEAAVDALTNEDDSALAEGVGQAEIDAAAKLVEALPGTTEVTDPPADDFNADKAALEADLAAAQVLQDGVNLAAAEAAVDALTNEDDSALAEGVGQAEIDAAAKLVEALPGTTEVTDPPADDFNADKAALEADLAAAQVLQDGVNLAAAEAAVDALTNEDDSALAEGVGQAEIDAAAKLVEALPGTTEVTDPPADDFNADKAALEADLAAAQVLQDGVNLAAAEAAVDALTNEDDSALAEGVGQAEIDAAAKLVEALPGTTEVTDPPADDFNADKAALEADLAAAQVLQDGVNLAAAEAAVDALTNEDDSALAEGVGQAEIDAAAKLVEALPGTTEVTDPPADDFNADKAALEADLAAAQVLQDGVNLAAAEAAVDALTNEDDSALAEGVGQAEIDAAAKLVEALPGTTEVTDPPADDFNADKAALEADLAAAQVLQDGVNLAAAEAAVDALTNEDDSALAEGVGQAEIDAAAKLVEALPGTTEVTDPPADDFNADKAALEADLAAAQVLQDGVNLAAAEAAVDALTNEDDSALAEGVGQAEIDAAAKLVEALPGTTEVTDPPADDFNADKAALEADLAAAQVLQDGVNLAAAEAAVDALTNEDDSALAEGVGQAEIDAAAKLVEALPGTTEVTDPPADDFNADKAALEADLAAAQVLQDGVNLAAAEAAVDALTNEDDSALAEGVGQAEIDAAAKLVEALPGTTEVTDPPADDFNADKAALEADLAAAQELLDVVTINAAIGEGDVIALQEIIVALDNVDFSSLSSAQRSELGAYIILQATTDETVFSSTTTFDEAVSTYVGTYTTNIAAFNTKANVDIASDATAAEITTAKNEIITAITDLTGTEYLAGLTSVQKLDLAEAILDAKPEAGYAVKTIAQVKAIVEANK